MRANVAKSRTQQGPAESVGGEAHISWGPEPEQPAQPLKTSVHFNDQIIAAIL